VLGRNVVLAEGGLPRLQSVYYSPNNVGLYLGRVWPLLVAVAVLPPRAACSTAARPVHRRRRVLHGMALVVVTLALGLSFSRGALLLGLPAALCAMAWRVGGRWRWAALALVLIGALALIPLLQVPRFASMFDLQQGSTFFRLELWRSSLALLREHPWFGVGPGNFPAAYRTRYVLPSAWREFNLEHPHNVYLDHWTRLGILGLLAGGAVQVAFWRTLLRRSQPSANRASHRRRFLAMRDAPGMGAATLSVGLAGSIAALLAHGLVDNTLFFPDLALVFFLTLALTQ
jgi:O-antigen ligase